MAKKIVGIYKITCTKNGKCYVGQSLDIKRRFNQHKRKPPARMREDFDLNELQPEYNIKTEGRGISDEAREKLRNLYTGIKRPNISRQIKCVETGEVFESIRAAAKWCNVPNSTIGILLAGKGRTAGGYHWEYLIA